MSAVNATMKEPSMPRLLFVVTGTGRGGAETQVVSLAGAFAKRGYDVGLVSLLPPGDFSDELQKEGIPLFSLRMKRGRASLVALFRFGMIVRQFRTDIIHSHMVHANLLTRLGRLFSRRIPLINTEHSIYIGGRAREIAYRFTDSMCDCFTIISRAAAERFVRVGAVPTGRIITVPNGIDTERFQRNRDERLRIRKELGIDDRFVWLAVGRFEAVKGYEIMLKAFRNVHNSAQKSVLLIAGSGALFEQSVALAVELKLGENVRFLGLRKDVCSLMSAADGFVLSSLYEGMPMVLLEAASCELPAVATAVGGNPEVILQAETGFLVTSGNVEELDKGMMQMMEMPQEGRLAMGSAARKHIVANFSLLAVVNEWESLYSQLLAKYAMQSMSR
jgi:glycosyltransferase involved in cell wall biosynthesis